jgi:hypothetical protein
MLGAEALIESAVSTYSDSSIQKYNGKSVSFSSLFKPLFCDSIVVAIFKVSSLRVADEVQLRSLLRGKGIRMQRYKSRYLKLFKRVLTVSANEDLGVVVNEFLRFMEGAAVVFLFDDVDHFLFFEKFFLLKLLKLRFSFYSLKVNDQNFLASSAFLKVSLALAKRPDYNLGHVKSFMYFQLLVIENFLFFLISLSCQIRCLNII